jgi:hypothetical protein
MKTFRVGLVSFGTMKSRFVDVPEAELSVASSLNCELDLIYHYGQNDFRPQKMRSVSVGDIIFLADSQYRVESTGFKFLDGAEDVWDAIAEEAGPFNERVNAELQRLYKVERQFIQYQKDMDHDDSK